MCQKKPFYITTPIYYPSGNPHIGHCYTTVACDSIARYRRMQGYDVMFLTGTDEHGLKIEQKAAEKGVTPKEYVDEIVKTFKGLWKFMNISYDRYIRTTDDYHIETVQKIFKELYDKGYIYKGEYKGKYCTPCESFWTESQLIDGKCPECGREVTEAKEEAYFFKMSSFADRIEKLLTETDYLQPKTRAVELVNNFIKPGLEDLCVSRTTFKWGIPVTFDEKHIVYVWIDALSNYISALGYKNEKFDEFDKYWPADVHMVAKDIMRFHAIIWPAMLMALDLPLPKHLAVHGWITFNGQKMSKSLGNVVDPFVLGERYGADAIRYHIMREMALGADSSFSNEIMINRINSDLANGLGNLVSRTVAMVQKYFGGSLPTERESGEFDDDLIETATSLRAKVDDFMDKTQLQKYSSLFPVQINTLMKPLRGLLPRTKQRKQDSQRFSTTFLRQSVLPAPFSRHLCQQQCQRLLSRLALVKSVPATKTATSSVYFLLISRFTREMHSSHELMLKRKLKNSTASSRTTRVKVKKQRHSVKSLRVLHRLALMTLPRLTSVCARLRPANPLKRAKSFYSSQFLTV